MKLLTDRIHLIMREAGIEQADLVEASGASYSVVGQWISGDIKSMRLDYALGIERNLGYSHIWLMINEGPKKALDGGQAPATLNRELMFNSDEVIELLVTFQGCDPEDRDAILAFARGAIRSRDARWSRTRGNKA